MSRRYTISDGKIVLHLERAKEGGYIVTSPLDPGLITPAKSVEEAFANARDAEQALKQARSKLLHARRRAAELIRRTWTKIDADVAASNISADEFESAIDEAMRHVRRRTH